MDKLQVEAVVQAMLTPDRAGQEEIQREKVAAARKLAEQRLVAKLGLIGCAVGAVVTYFAGWHLAPGVIWGGIAGAVTGWAFVF